MNTEATLQANRSLTEESIKVGAERARILKAARPLLAAGDLTLSRIASICGTTASQICKLNTRFAHLTDDELTPENLAGKFTNAGRRSTWEEVANNPEVQKRLQQLYLSTVAASSDAMTKGRKTGSMALAIEGFAHDRLCPDHLRNDLLRGKQPAPLKRIVRQITTEMEQRYRGARHFELNGSFVSTLQLVETMEDGSDRKIEPGDYWVFDDMSANHPHWFIGPNDEPMVGRQGLYAYDLTRKWLGLEKVGTARDSYTAAIILRFIRRLMLSIGKPRYGIVLEQSVWKSRVIAGVRVTSGGEAMEDEYERGAMSDEDKALIQDGLEGLGIKVIYAHTPRGKEIEGAFQYFQRVCQQALHQHYLDTGRKIVHIGRHRGEFEAGAKALRRAHAQSHHPQALGFFSIDDSRDFELKVMQRIDARIVDREFSDKQRWDASMLASPLKRLSERDLAVFLPKAHELEIRGGKVWPTVDGDTYEFSNGDVFAALGNGYRLYVRFDPSEPTLGAAIYNRELSSLNHSNYQDGQFMCWADFIPPGNRFNWSEAKEGDSQRKRFNKFVRTAFGSVDMPKDKAATFRDGTGTVREVTGSRSAAIPQRTGNEAAEPKHRVKKGIQAPTEAEAAGQRVQRRKYAEIAKKLLNQS